MKGQSNSIWQGRIRRFLADGYGADDIAVMMQCHPRHVRAEIEIMRDENRLQAFFQIARERWATQ